jgi:hypothetical protein
MVSLQSSAFKAIDCLSNAAEDSALEKATQVINQQDKQEKFHQHTWGDHGTGWKNLLNNLRLLIQP